MPKNILKAFVISADLRTQVAAFLYGTSPPDNPQVQRNQGRSMDTSERIKQFDRAAITIAKDDFLLKDLEPLGWIKTQSSELMHLSPTDVTTQSKIMADHPEWGPSSICVTCSFTPGSISLASYQLTVPGFEWGRRTRIRLLTLL